MAVMNTTYKARDYNLSGLNGISDRTLEIHFKLYQGYVTNTNALNSQLADLRSGGPLDPQKLIQFSELKRRLGFEYNGMVLHEYYFENLRSGGGGDPSSSSSFLNAVNLSFGSYNDWKVDFLNVARMRGVGWVVTLRDPASGALSNHWVSLHEEGNVAGFNPVLVMDLWEHAFFLDYVPAERMKYVEAFFSNVNWDAVDSRLRAIG